MKTSILPTMALALKVDWLDAYDAPTYFALYQPVLLRNSVKSGTEYDGLPLQRMNFGKSKGLGFARTVILPTKPQLQFLQDDPAAFGNGKTEEARNRFYVALTRARYSVGVIIPDILEEKCHLPVWARP